MTASQAIRRQEIEPQPLPTTATCEHRTVARDGRIVCAKIVEGENEVPPDVCRTCPLKAVNCAHLRFSLRQVSPSPLIVRFNGRTEIWDDGPAEVRFEQAACAAKVTPIEHPRQCVGCTLRQPIQRQSEQTTHPPRRREARGGKVVPFPLQEIAAAAG
jgi:hypothetical protein